MISKEAKAKASGRGGAWKWALDSALFCAGLARGVEGDFIELGVFQGRTLLPIAGMARELGKHCHGVDSFAGLAQPTKEDGIRGSQFYPKGKFDTKGTEMLEARLEVAGLTGHVTLWRGFVPGILKRVQVDKIAFAHVDLDHYRPTLLALRWLWPLMSPGGVVAIHDYVGAPEKGILAKGATDVFCAEQSLRLCGVHHGTAWIIKGKGQEDAIQG